MEYDTRLLLGHSEPSNNSYISLSDTPPYIMQRSARLSPLAEMTVPQLEQPRHHMWCIVVVAPVWHSLDLTLAPVGAGYIGLVNAPENSRQVCHERQR
jgi:hypothetical protein